MNDGLLIHGSHLDHRKTCLVINFQRLIHSEIILMEFNLTMHKENVEQSHQLQGQRLSSQVMTDKIKAQFQCLHLQQGRRP